MSRGWLVGVSKLRPDAEQIETYDLPARSSRPTAGRGETFDPQHGRVTGDDGLDPAPDQARAPH
jgi:hypothetical protein